jgi:hypothetical protein
MSSPARHRALDGGVRRFAVVGYVGEVAVGPAWSRPTATGRRRELASTGAFSASSRKLAAGVQHRHHDLGGRPALVGHDVLDALQKAYADALAPLEAHGIGPPPPRSSRRGGSCRSIAAA